MDGQTDLAEKKDWVQLEIFCELMVSVVIFSKAFVLSAFFFFSFVFLFKRKEVSSAEIPPER